MIRLSKAFVPFSQKERDRQLIAETALQPSFVFCFHFEVRDRNKLPRFFFFFRGAAADTTVLSGVFMKLLEERIRRDGKVCEGNILRVDSFLNHQIDPRLMRQLADEFRRLFADQKIDKVLTVEASGIAIAIMVAAAFEVPLVFAKKAKSKNIDNDNVYSADVVSFTHGTVNKVIISKEFLHAGERVLLIDDFLANGQAMLGLMDVAAQAGAEVAGIGIMVEKSYQKGRALLEDKGVRVESLARVASMDAETGVHFVGEV